MKRLLSTLLMIAVLQGLQGCGLREPMPAEHESETPTLTPRASTYYDLINMPRPRGRLMAVVYGFRDQTGQYKPTPASSFSTSVTQGAASMLMDALNASGWFVVLEREGLQNLLTERKIIRASQKKADVPENIQAELPPLQAANLRVTSVSTSPASTGSTR
jgi:curli production assembly/transport component CsgG